MSADRSIDEVCFLRARLCLENEIIKRSMISGVGRSLVLAMCVVSHESLVSVFRCEYSNKQFKRRLKP